MCSIAVQEANFTFPFEATIGLRRFCDQYSENLSSRNALYFAWPIAPAPALLSEAALVSRPAGPFEKLRHLLTPTEFYSKRERNTEFGMH